MRLKKLENQLQIEESGPKIANIQGKLAEFRSMICDEGFDDVEV